MARINRKKLPVGSQTKVYGYDPNLGKGEILISDILASDDGDGGETPSSEYTVEVLKAELVIDSGTPSFTVVKYAGDYDESNVSFTQSFDSEGTLDFTDLSVVNGDFAIINLQTSGVSLIIPTQLFADAKSFFIQFYDLAGSPTDGTCILDARLYKKN